MSASQRGRSASVPHSRPPTSASSSAHRLRADGDTPHKAGSAECLCSSCHLKTYFFPRRPDGRIVLPSPHLTRSERTSNVGPVAPSRGSREARDRAVSIPRRVRVDRGEETPAGSIHLSGPGVPASVGEGWSHLPPLLRDFDFPNIAGRATIRVPAPESHPTRPDRPRPSRAKPYDSNTGRPEPWPRISTPGTDQLPPCSQSHPSGHSGHHIPNPYTETAAAASSSGRTFWLHPDETIDEEPFPRHSRSPTGLSKRDLNISGTSSTLSQTSQDSEPHRTPSVPFQSFSRPEYQPSRNDQVNMPPPDQVVPSQVPPCEIGSTNIESPPKFIRFNSRHNPQPNTWGARTSVEDVLEDRSQEGTLQQQTHTGMLRFQNPMVPESHIPVSTPTKELSIVHVKWDSERKRRQGYFAQEEGSEKSPFRHYNKTGCDFSGG